MDKRKETLKERGISIYLPLETMTWLRETAKQEERSCSNLVAYILKKEMELKQNKK